MLLPNEEGYIQAIPEDKIVSIKPFDPKLTETAEEIILQVNTIFPSLEVMHMGASALGISGQNDLDLYMFSSPQNFERYLDVLIKIFGNPRSKKEDSVGWKFTKNGFDVELYLTDPDSEPMKRQIGVYQGLKNSPELLREYEVLKEKMNGKSFREYQKKKYEFYHKILTLAKQPVDTI